MSTPTTGSHRDRHDLFAPPRRDVSSKPGWGLAADDDWVLS